MSFAMTVDGQPIFGGGQSGVLGTLTDPAKAWPLKLDVEAGGAKVAIGGSIQDAVGVSGLGLTLAVSGQSFATLSPLAGAPIPPVGPYSISTKARGGLRTAIELANISVKIEKSDTGGHLKSKLGGKRPSVNGAFKSTLIDWPISNRRMARNHSLKVVKRWRISRLSIINRRMMAACCRIRRCRSMH